MVMGSYDKTICPDSCVKLTWYILGAWSTGTWQSLTKQHAAPDKHFSSKCQTAWQLIGTAYCKSTIFGCYKIWEMCCHGNLHITMQGRMQEFSGGRAKNIWGKWRVWHVSWGTLSALARRAEPRRESGEGGGCGKGIPPPAGEVLGASPGKIWQITHEMVHSEAFSVKCAPPRALSLRNLPHLGHFQRKICPTWATFTAECVPPGALLPLGAFSP